MILCVIQEFLVENFPDFEAYVGKYDYNCRIIYIQNPSNSMVIISVDFESKIIHSNCFGIHDYEEYSETTLLMHIFDILQKYAYMRLKHRQNLAM